MGLLPDLRHTLTAVGLCLAAVAHLVAQNPNDPFNFRDKPGDPIRTDYWGLGGGYLGSVFVPSYDGVNTIAADLELPEFSGPIIMSGGGGFVSVFFFQPNLRFGFYGMGGSKKVTATRTADGQTPVVRSLDLRHSVAAAQLDYAIRISSTLTLAPGTMVGLGSFDLESTQSPANGAGVSVLNPDSTSAAYNARLSSKRIFFYPSLNLEWVPAKVLMLRLGGGYAGTLASDWRDNNDVVVSGMPKIDANGPAVQFGVFVGLFQMK